MWVENEEKRHEQEPKEVQPKSASDFRDRV